MEWVINEDRLPIKSWCSDIEGGAMEQAHNLANLPFAFRHIALMPDCHQGYGMPIGGVMATLGAIVPNAVGVDIGCGMRAVKTDCQKRIQSSTVKKIFEKSREAIPLGFNHHEEDQDWEGFDAAPDIPVIQQQLNPAKKQLGTLGGGNHFIEIQMGSDGCLWLMIHSGSRNFGYKIAKAYHDIAKELCQRWFSNIPHMDLSFLPIGSQEANEYVKAMTYALSFAAANRALMMRRFMNIVAEILGCEFFDVLDIHHNYARWENHFGKNVIVHRKGATSARAGEQGIIPGSQGTASYIVEGLGNPESFASCSHGAGRIMGRKQAQRELSLEEQAGRLDRRNIVHSIRGNGDLDEAPGAYKDINEVMAAQADLVKTLIELRPLGVMKG